MIHDDRLTIQLPQALGQTFLVPREHGPQVDSIQDMVGSLSMSEDQSVSVSVNWTLDIHSYILANFQSFGVHTTTQLNESPGKSEGAISVGLEVRNPDNLLVSEYYWQSFFRHVMGLCCCWNHRQRYKVCM